MNELEKISLNNSNSSTVDRFTVKTFSDSSLTSGQTKSNRKRKKRGKKTFFKFFDMKIFSSSDFFEWLRIEFESNLSDRQLSSAIGQRRKVSSNVLEHRATSILSFDVKQEKTSNESIFFSSRTSNFLSGSIGRPVILTVTVSSIFIELKTRAKVFFRSFFVSFVEFGFLSFSDRNFEPNENGTQNDQSFLRSAEM